MRNEDIRLSQKQLQVYHVLRCVLDDKVTLKEAAEAVGYSYRHLGRLLSEVEEHGAQGLIHGNRGRPPSNKTPDEMRARVVELSERKYTAFNDTHFTDMLTEREGMNISRETVRAIRRGEGIAPKRKRRVAGKHRMCIRIVTVRSGGMMTTGVLRNSLQARESRHKLGERSTWVCTVDRWA